MTKDEAVKRITSALYDRHSESWEVLQSRSERLVCAFVALGMLKLDEPKSASDRMIDVLEKHIPHAFIGAVLFDLEHAGLKIMEK